MMTNLFLFGIPVLIVAMWATRANAKLTRALSQRTGKTRYPELLSVTLLAIQASDLVSIVEHANVVNLCIATVVLVILVAVRSGTEGEMH
jgi:hypothetical protein